MSEIEKSPQKRIYLIRHGETDANKKHYVPSKEEPLNDTGLRQATALAKRIEKLQIEKLVVSDFLRAQQTIEPIEKQMRLNAEVIPAFGEMLEPTSLHGVSENSDEVAAYRQKRNTSVENFEWRQEDGETFYDMHQRINDARKYLEVCEARSILVVSHTFFLQCFVASILLDTREPTNNLFQVTNTLGKSNTGVTYLTYEKEKWRLVMWNDHAHFAE